MKDMDDNVGGAADRPDADNLGGLVRELYPVPETPREAMWMRIQEERARGGRAGRVLALPRRVPRGAWGAAALLAATLAVGVGIGRMTGPVPVQDGGAAAPRAAADPAASPYHAAAVTHLVSAQALLATFPADAGAGRSGEVAAWAGKLLMTTRLLRDTPAAEDPQIAALLADLEILLAQLSALPEDASESAVRTEVDIINDGIDRKNVLPRIRVATAGRAAAEP